MIYVAIFLNAFMIASSLTGYHKYRATEESYHLDNKKHKIYDTSKQNNKIGSHGLYVNQSNQKLSYEGLIISLIMILLTGFSYWQRASKFTTATNLFYAGSIVLLLLLLENILEVLHINKHDTIFNRISLKSLSLSSVILTTTSGCINLLFIIPIRFASITCILLIGIVYIISSASHKK